MNAVLWFALLPVPASAQPESPATQPAPISQEAVDAAMERLRQRQAARERAAAPATATPISPGESFPPEVHRRRDELLSAFVHDFVLARDERNRVVASRPPKGSSGREWGHGKRASLAELSQKVASRQARAKAFEQLPMAEVARLLTEFDTKKAAREKLVDRTVRTQYRTVRLAGDAVLERLDPALQNARFVRDADASGRPEAIYVVSYVSRDGLVRAARLHVHLNPQFADPATDAGPYGYYPAGASLELPDGQIQQLEFTDPAPADVSIEWDGRTGFAVAGGVP